MASPSPSSASATSPDAESSPRPPLDERSRALRRTIVRTLAAGDRGHLGSAFSLVEILRVLYDDVLRFDPRRPGWAERDRLVLSKGHGCLALYALLADHGFFPADELDRFCDLDGLLGGHPEACVPGVEVATGSLGHGLSIGVGFALAARLRGADWRTVVVLGDGEANEGSVWEAAMAAAKHGLERLTAVIDCNGLQSYGPTEVVQPMEPMADKWRAFGFATREIDGHSVSALSDAFGALPFEPGRPSALVCRTVKGCGVAECEHNPAWHHRSRLAPEVVARLLAALAPMEAG
ncbi:MAG: transketolase [Acidobacteriota bacterium]